MKDAKHPPDTRRRTRDIRDAHQRRDSRGSRNRDTEPRKDSRWGRIGIDVARSILFYGKSNLFRAEECDAPRVNLSAYYHNRQVTCTVRSPTITTI